MAKYNKTLDCISKNETKGRATVLFAEDVKQVPGQAPTAKNVISVVFTDPKEAAQFEAGQPYTVTIE